jgi:high-affinity Fe2+/Pb2+ permease
MKNPWALFAIILSLLAAYALYASNSAYQRGERATGFILIIIAMIFVKRIQGHRS